MEKINEFKGIKFDGIQILRCLAALLVASFHIDFIFNLNLKTSIGVDIFFVISGFLIMYTTQNGIKDYAKKRIIKIVPLYWLLTFLTFFSTFFIKGIVPYKPTFIELLKSLFFIPYSRDSIRTGEVIRPIVGPAHTLLNEMFFYLVFWISAKINHKNRGKITSGILFLLIIIGKFFDVSNIAPLRVWTSLNMIDFISGIMLFYILKLLYKKNKFDIKKEYALVLLFTSLIGIIIMIFTPKMNVLFKAILSAYAVASFLIAFLDKVKVLSIPKFIGDISYSFFLIHYFIILIFKKFIDPMDKIRNKISNVCCKCNNHKFRIGIFIL